MLLLLDLDNSHAVQPLVNLPPFAHRLFAHFAQPICLHDFRPAALSSAAASNVLVTLGTAQFCVVLSSTNFVSLLVLWRQESDVVCRNHTHLQADDHVSFTESENAGKDAPWRRQENGRAA